MRRELGMLDERVCLLEERKESRDKHDADAGSYTTGNGDVNFALGAARWCNTFWHVDTSASC
jgi:hypothetical protein